MIELLDPDQLPQRDFWSAFVDDLTSRGALGGALAGVYTVIALGWWWNRNRRVRLITASMPIRILVAGSRGKSSTVRLIHAALTHAGYRAIAKCTGTAAAQISVDSTHKKTSRLGHVSILEMLDALLQVPKQNADVIVFENMAVTPHLIKQVSEEIVHPSISVITNSHVDHMEEEGTSREQVMLALAEVVDRSSHVITAEREDLTLTQLRLRAESTGGEVVVVQADPLMCLCLPHSHPENIAITLGVTRALGIDDSICMAGMEQASTEIGDTALFSDLSAEGMCFRIIDLGAINDPESATKALLSAHGRFIPDAPVVAVLVGRSDRPLRALEFAAMLAPGVVDAVFLRGGPVIQCRKILLENGWDSRNVSSLRFIDRRVRFFTWRIKRVLERLQLPTDHVNVVLMENVHDPVMGSLRHDFDHGYEHP